MSTQEQPPMSASAQYAELNRVQNALTNKNETDEAFIHARLEQLHEQLRHTHYKDSWAKLEEERQAFITSVGEFDPLLMSRQFGFEYSGKSVFPVDDGTRVAVFRKGTTKVSLHKHQHTGKDGLQVHIEHNTGTREAKAESKVIPLPKTPEQFYDIISGLNLGFNFSAKSQAAYELGYVKSKKQVKQ